MNKRVNPKTVEPSLSNIVSYFSGRFHGKDRVTRDSPHAVQVEFVFESTGFGDGFFVKGYTREDGSTSDLTEIIKRADAAGTWKYGIESTEMVTDDEHRWVSVIFFFQEEGADAVFLASLAMAEPASCQDTLRQ